MKNIAILRPLDSGESFFFMSDHVSCMNFVVHAERSGTLLPERIRNALDQIQQENLLLQASIGWIEEKGLCFIHAPDQSIELRCHSVPLEHGPGIIEQQFSEPFAAGTAPLMRCLYLELQSPTSRAQAPNRSMLALCFHHSVGDGRSGTELMRRLLSVIANGAKPGESIKAASLPTLTETFPQRYRWAQQPEAAKQLRNTLIGDYRRLGPLSALPWLASQASGRTPRLIRLNFAQHVTQRLVTLSRDNGSSVHGALCAAQLMAQFKLQPGLDPMAFFLSCPVDMRPHLEPVQPVTPTGLFASIVSAAFSIDASTAIWALARDIIIQTRLQIARGEGHLFFNMYGLDGSPVLPHFMATFNKKLLTSMPHTMVSNIGPVATVNDDPAVEAISFALCPMPYQTLFTAASTYQDELILNVAFDAARLTETDAQRLTRSLREILLTAVGEA